MKCALMLNEQSCQKRKPQEHLFITTSITPETNYRRYLAYLGLTVKKRKYANFLVTDLVPMAF
jgi:hypothetical protein